MDSLPPDVLAAVFDFLSIEEAARVSDATRSKYRNIFQACIEGRQLFMPTSWQNQLTLVSDIEIEFTSIFASFRVVARMCLHEGEDYDERIRLRRARVHCPMLRMAYQMECWRNAVCNSRLLCIPCSWCGIPTEKKCGMLLDECDGQVCGDCKDRWLGCRKCTQSRSSSLSYGSVGPFAGLPHCLVAQWIVHAYRLAYRHSGVFPPVYGHDPGSYTQSRIEQLASQLMKGNAYWKSLF